MTTKALRKAKEDNGFLEFCQQMVSRQDEKEFLWTGSFYELPIKYFLENITDIDSIICRRNICAIPPNVKPPAQFNGTVLTIQSNGSHPGFAKLMCNRRGEGATPYTSKDFPREEGSKNPATIKILLNRKELESLYSIVFDRAVEINEITRDWVDAIHCPYWPPEAEEWKTRKRLNGWPTEDLIKNVSSGGCLFVIKPHQSNPDNDTEWRFSFSRAELILIHSWSDVQTFIYHILRLIKSDVVKKCGGQDKTHLRTYHFKTLILWACEQKPREIWDEACMNECLTELLCNMIAILIDKECWNYFIRRSNMLDHLTEEYNFTDEVQNLLVAIENIDKFIDSSVLAPRKSSNLNSRKLCLKFSNKLFLSTVLSFNRSNVLNPSQPVSVQYKPAQPLEKTVLLQAELIDIYNALLIHQRFVCEKPNGLQIAEAVKCFERSKERPYTGFTTVQFSLSDNGHEIFEKMIQMNLQCIGDDTDVDSRDEEINSKKAKLTNSIYDIADIDRLDEIADPLGGVVNEVLINWLMKIISDHIPKSSYFLCAAFEANFHYTVLNDLRKAFELCHTSLVELFAVMAVGYSRLFAYDDELLPILITNRWSPIYDEYIQILIGFLTLCTNTKIRERRSNTYENLVPSARKPGHVLLQIHPHYFLMYLKIQCKIKLSTISEALEEASDDILELKDTNTLPKFFLFTAIKITKEPFTKIGLFRGFKQ